MESKYSNILIKGVSTVVPHTVVDNVSLIDKYGQKKVNMQINVTGIERRHIADNHIESKDLCCQAAQKLLEAMNIAKEEIKVMIFVTQTASFVMPSTAFWIHNQLGLTSDCIAFDINLGCSGFVAGLNVIAALLSGQEKGTKGLLLNGDTLSQYVDEEDLGTCLLFGDAGTATLVETNPQQSFTCVQQTKSQGYDKLIIKDFKSSLYMDGMHVYHFTINEGIQQITELKQQFDKKVDYYLLHQANKYVIESMTDLCKLEKEKVLTSYKEYGNVSGATIPLTICKHCEKFEKEEVYWVLVSGFGVGLSYASAYVKLDKPFVLPIMEYYE